MDNKEIKQKLEAARKEVNTDPSEAQKKAENYAKGKVRINGFLITIENPKGSYRKGKDRNGKQWKTYMHNDYGYFNRTVGKDGDAIDVFIGPNYQSDKIFAVDQRIGGEFDETKVMMCFNDEQQAKEAYLSNYAKGWKGFWHITAVDVDTFKEWLYDGYRQRKPFFEYVQIKKKKLNENAEPNSKEGETVTPDEKEAFERDVNGMTNSRSKIEYGGLEINEYGTKVLTLYGGLNGSGDWSDYLEDILAVYEAISAKYDVWVLDLDADALDDVWSLKLGVDTKKAEG